MSASGFRLDRDSLVDRLVADIHASGKKNILIQAGHFPLTYDTARDTLREDLREWGAFSPYTFEVGCAVAQECARDGLTTSIVLLADDHKYEEEYEGLRAEFKEQGKRASQWNAMRKRFFREHNGAHALHPLYRQIMLDHELTPMDLITQDQQREGRRTVAYHSEKMLRANGGLTQTDCSVQNAAACRAEYVEVLRTLTNANTHLISFVPLRCLDGVSDAVLFGMDGKGHENVPHLNALASTHVYMPTDRQLTRTDLQNARMIPSDPARTETPIWIEYRRANKSSSAQFLVTQ